MKKLALISLLLFFTHSSFSQKDILTAKTRAELLNNLDSALHTCFFISNSDAQKVLEKPVFLKDSTYKFSSGILRYSFDYIATFVDSTSKGRISFSFEQYKDTTIAKANYDYIKSENIKEGNTTEVKNIGNDAFVKRDNLNQPFLMFIKNNKIFKIRVMYWTTNSSYNELLSLAKKIDANH